MSIPIHTDLQISGMHCASCSAPLEKVLNKLPDVAATVNIATEKAHITYDPHQTDLATLIIAIQGEGFDAHPLRDFAARHTEKIRQNLFFAFAYNVPGFPLACLACSIR